MDAEQALRVRPNRPRLEQLTLTSSTLRLAVPKQTSARLGGHRGSRGPVASTGSLGVLRSRAAVPGFDDRYEPQDPLARARLRRITTRSLTCASREIRSARPAEHFVLAFNGILT